MNQDDEKKICGIVMPISTLDGCNESHWSDVLEIINEAIEKSGFEGNLVSNADDVGIIQKRIIQNLYENPIVVCDVSGKNPNVMFELGMRLAFDKPTIIIKDDRTTYSFDTSPIEHIEYPRDLRFSKIVDFKAKLAEKIKATFDKSKNDASYTTFLKHFGEFKVAKIDKKEVSGQEFILDELKSIRMGMRRLERSSIGKEANIREFISHSSNNEDFDYCMDEASNLDVKRALDAIILHPGVISANIIDLDQNHKHLQAKLSDPKIKDELEILIRSTSSKNRIYKHNSIRKNS